MIADSAATISAVPLASDLDQRTGTKRVLMADNSVQDTPSGLSNVYVHGNDVHNGINITVPTAVLRGLKSRILSLPYVVYELGFKCVLNRDGWEGIYKFDPATKTTVEVPFFFDRSKRLWLLNYSTGKSNADARKRAIDKTETIQAVWSTNNNGRQAGVPLTNNRSQDQQQLHSVLLFESSELDGNSTTVTLTSRRRERILTRFRRHRKLLHLGPSGCPDGCAVCRQVKQRIRQVHKPRLGKPRPNPTPNYNNVPGHTVHMDSAYWDVSSLEGCNYTVQAVDSCSAYYGGFHSELRSDVTLGVGKYIESERSNPELNCPDFCRVIVLDDAGEWRKTNPAFMAEMTRLHIHVIVHPKGDKRQSAFAEGAVQKMKLMVQAGLIDLRLPATWWQRLADYSWHVHNLYPVQRKAATGVTPIEDISSGNVTRAVVERRIEYATPPGTLCMVAEPGKHGGAFDASNCKLGLVKRMDDDVAVFVNPTGRQHERRSKNFWAYDLRPGLSPWTHLRMSHDTDLTPPSCLPADVENIRRTMHVIELRGLLHSDDANDSSDLRGFTGPGDVEAPSHVHVDSLGNVYVTNDENRLQPTGGLMLHIPANQITDADERRQRELLLHYLEHQPEWLVGALAHQHFDEWGGVARGVITGFDTDFHKAWSVVYEADGVVARYSKSCMIDYVIDRKDGLSNKDGGLSLMMAYRNGAVSNWGDDDDSSDDDDGNQNTSTHPQDEHIPAGTQCITTDEDETFDDVCNRAHVHSDKRRDYYIWLRQFKIGNGHFRGEDGAIWFATPFKASKQRTKFKQGTKFPIPMHLIAREHRQPSDNNLAARIELLAEESMLEAMLQTHETIKVTINIDEVIDEKGVPIPPANMTELEKRKYKADWEAAWQKEWQGIMEREILKLNLSKSELINMGILLPAAGGKRLVNMQMLFESKMLDGAFNKFKCRLVAQGHPGAVRKHIDYDSVFAPAPHLESARMFRAFEVLLGWNAVDFDINQAYLIGKADPDQQYPVRLPAGPIREQHKQADGTETYALIKGNLYGLPTAARTYTKERHRLILSELPKRTGWTASKLLREPCCYHLNTGHKSGNIFSNIHTDDADNLVQRKEDVKPFLAEMNTLFGNNGKDGIRVGDGKDLLGIHRERWMKNGIRYIRLTQSGHIDKTFDLHCKARRDHQQRPPTFPFPVGDGHPVLDNMNKAVGVTPEEAKEVLEGGFRQILGCELWTSRCTMPDTSYAASVLSKCMAAPSRVARAAAEHLGHFMHANRERGIQFNSHGNLEPICYFDSGYRQKKLYDKPQYGYIIFWGGAPIIWKSKRHSQIPQSVSQAEFETITHAWRDIKWVREMIKELGLGKYVERPTPVIGDNQNSITWAKEDMMADGNRHFEHKYFTIRERVALGEIAMYWLSGKLNPADVTTKALDKAVTVAHSGVISGQAPLPIPKGCKVLFGPLESPREISGDYFHANQQGS